MGSTEEGNKMEVQSDKNSEKKKALEPVTKTISKQFMSQVRCHENMEKVEIKIQFHGHKFKAENLDVQVINEDILVVKAEDDGEKFERKSKFDTKEEGIQTLAINIPKDVKKFQVPISMEE